ncbi:RNA polymerase sigma-like factor [Morganella phage vB_Mm5]
MNTNNKKEKQKNIYADNNVLYPIICKWKQDRKTNPTARMPEELGEAILDIAHGLVKRWNFNQYTWKQDMVDDAIAACVSGLHNFDETRYDNVYGYINKACWQAFLMRIYIEKAEDAKKWKMFLETYDANDDDMVQLANDDFVNDIHKKIAEYEQDLETRKQNRKLAVQERVKINTNTLDFLEV